MSVFFLFSIILHNPNTSLSESRIFADYADYADFVSFHLKFTFMSELRFLLSNFRISISDFEEVWRNGKTGRNTVLPTFQTSMLPTFQPNYRSKICNVKSAYSKVYNYLDTVGRGYKPRQRGWGGAATLQNVNLFLDFTINPL